MGIDLTKLCAELDLCGYTLICNVPPPTGVTQIGWVLYEIISDDYHVSMNSVQELLDTSFALCYPQTYSGFAQQEKEFKNKRQKWINNKVYNNTPDVII